MDVKNVNPFLDACALVLPQLGFTSVSKKNITVSDKVNAKGVAISVGIIGDIKGTVVYNFSEENAKKIASKMMMGMEVPDFDDMAQSAISELTNMLTANASIEFSKIGKICFFTRCPFPQQVFRHHWIDLGIKNPTI